MRLDAGVGGPNKMRLRLHYNGSKLRRKPARDERFRNAAADRLDRCQFSSGALSSRFALSLGSGAVFQVMRTRLQHRLDRLLFSLKLAPVYECGVSRRLKRLSAVNVAVQIEVTVEQSEVRNEFL